MSEVENQPSYFTCPKCHVEQVHFFTQKKLLKNLVWGYSICMFLFFAGIVETLLQSNIAIICFSAGVFPLAWAFAQNLLYARINASEVICGNCKRVSNKFPLRLIFF